MNTNIIPSKHHTTRLSVPNTIASRGFRRDAVALTTLVASEIARSYHARPRGRARRAAIRTTSRGCTVANAKTATAPPNTVIVALAMFLTAFVMGPVLQKSYDDGIKPLISNDITVEQALVRASGPLRGFMQKNVREKDVKLFMDLSGEPPPATPDEMSLRILVPAFMISELKRAFEIGFLLFLPFLIIDLVVASVLMSMGMMMLPPVVVSLPFKLIFFVLVDGWSLVAGSLVQSYGS
jgi:flagellar biosynthetic protein FliP